MFERQNFAIYKIPKNATGTDFYFKSKGTRFVVLSPILPRDTVLFFSSYKYTNAIPLSPGIVIDKKFDACMVRVDNTQINLYFLIGDESFDYRAINKFSTKCVVVAAGNNEASEYGIEKIYVSSFGNVVITDINGTEIIIPNVPAGTMLEVPCFAIRNTTTANVVVFEYDLQTVGI